MTGSRHKGHSDRLLVTNKMTSERQDLKTPSNSNTSGNLQRVFVGGWVLNYLSNCSICEIICQSSNFSSRFNGMVCRAVSQAEHSLQSSCKFPKWHYMDYQELEFLNAVIISYHSIVKLISYPRYHVCWCSTSHRSPLCLPAHQMQFESADWCIAVVHSANPIKPFHAWQFRSSMPFSVGYPRYKSRAWGSLFGNILVTFPIKWT